jgi:isoleucyl-tRNA synthetase
MLDFPQKEKEILSFWEKNKIFDKTLKKDKRKTFVFFEGPPTLNGEPGIHHVLSRSFKDLILRYKTMNGFFVPRKAGWDTHGLPVELEAEKRIQIKTKKDIEKYGIEKFNSLCRKIVLDNKKDWDFLTKRIGFWLDLENPYITFDASYIESVWFLIKKIWEKGLLYEDFRVSPYCPRCQTILSSHEVAQGYRRIKEKAIYVKFKLKDLISKSASYLLIWTTTPWTLPGNVAVALNPNFEYLMVKKDGEILILAKERAKILGIQGKTIKKVKGKDLVGLKYEPPFNFYQPDFKKERIWEILPADFVSLREGTGLVHIAPAFGEEDMELIKIQNSKLKTQNLPGFPIILNVNEEGKFKNEVKKFAGLFVKEADPLITQDLKERGLLFKEELYEHDYPFCWRCKTSLLYFAKKSWFIKMSALKRDLIQNNRKINWIPNYLKEGRFGEWLREVKDWALSRERYWGTPLPIWKCQNCGHTEVIGSLKEILNQKFSTNKYFILRHGQTIYQTKMKNRVYPKEEKENISLTKKGAQEIEKVAKILKKEKIDLIYSSDFLRTKQTSEILAKVLNVRPKFDPRLRDVNLGVYHGRSKKDYFKEMPPSIDRFDKKVPEGESWLDCQKRMVEFISEIDRKHQNKTILIVSHGDPLWLLEGAMKGKTREELIKEKKEGKTIDTGELRKLEFKNLPFNEKGEIDFHRPFIDKVEFFCPKCQGKMKRVSEVIDCWFDSGAMPFAQGHFPFAWAQIQNSKFKIQNFIKKGFLFPADFICEGIDQTRGWFYTLLAISTALGFGISYRNVLSLGHVLDKKGEKMSKSKGNVVNPFLMVEKYGADALRWYFFRINQPWESKKFDEEDIKNLLNKFLRPLWNAFCFYELYAPRRVKKFKKSLISHVLDRWIFSRLQRVIKNVKESLNKYFVFEAARELEEFVLEDFSNFYLKLSRERFQENKENFALLREILLTLSKLTAPFIPFLSERIYQKLGQKTSVHLENYPKEDKSLISPKVEKEIKEIREILSLALKERKKIGIKLRQPLSELKVKNFSGFISKQSEEILLEGANVKKVVFQKGKGKLKISLNPKITPELEFEGLAREFIRKIQGLRKEAGLKVADKILLEIEGGGLKIKEAIKIHKVWISKKILAKEIYFEKQKGTPFLEKEIEIDGSKFRVKFYGKNFRSQSN